MRKIISLIEVKLTLAGIDSYKVEKTGGEFKVTVNSVSDVFKAETVSRVLASQYGVESYVAY